MRVHGVPIKIERGMADEDLTRAIRYGAHSFATKKTTFVRTELQEQAQAGHIALFPLRAVRHLPQLCLSPPRIHPAAREKTTANLRLLLERPQRGGHPGSSQRGNVIWKSPVQGDRLHHNSTLQARPHLPQQIRPSRCIHVHLGTPRRHTIDGIPSAKSYTQ